METITLGRTGLKTSLVGLGAGGPSRLGQRTGRERKESVALVRRAMDLGINFIDTAEAYNTEAIVAEAIQGVDRDTLILSTKKGVRKGEDEDSFVSADEYEDGVHACLQRLNTDYVDIFHVHGVRRHQYEHVRQEILPVLKRCQEQGKIRFLAISEAFNPDPDHRMFQRALQDDFWDVVMVGFNMLNQSARQRVLATTRKKGIATECMFAVRRAFSRPERLREIVAELVEQGEVDAADVDLDNPLGFVLEESDADNLAEAAYRFCRHEPGLDLILTGTGNVDHLEENVQSILAPPLPDSVVRRLRRIFADVDSVSGQ